MAADLTGDRVLAPQARTLLATRAELEWRAARLWAAPADGALRVQPVERHSLAKAGRVMQRQVARPPVPRR